MYISYLILGNNFDDNKTLLVGAGASNLMVFGQLKTHLEKPVSLI